MLSAVIFATTTVGTYVRESSQRTWAKRARMFLGLTQQELADTVGVLKEEVDLFECNLPIPLDIKHKLNKKLYVAKSASKYQLSFPL